MQKKLEGRGGKPAIVAVVVERRLRSSVVRRWCKPVVVVRWRCKQHGRGVVSAAESEEDCSLVAVLDLVRAN